MERHGGVVKGRGEGGGKGGGELGRGCIYIEEAKGER